ncbi:hypothetical protein MMC11_008771 [Xylographa trunciseda]|nr:hypothetical protein [Xylographa trunciseda]
MRLHTPAFLLSVWEPLRRHLPPLNFITLHYLYFIGVCMVTSVIFWGASTPARSVTYTDSLFLVVSAMSEAGLNTVNLSQLNTFQQFLLFLLIMLGSAILVSSAVVHVRRAAFERRFKDVITADREKRKQRKNSGLGQPHDISSERKTDTRSNIQPQVDGIVVRGRAIHSPGRQNGHISENTEQDSEHQAYNDRDNIYVNTSIGRGDSDEMVDAVRLSSSDDKLDSGANIPNNAFVSPRIRFESPSSPVGNRMHRRVFSMSGVGARSDISDFPKFSDIADYNPTLATFAQEKDKLLRGTHKYFSSGGFIGRNSQFHGLTLAERERLGGVEYRAVTLLEIIVPVYFVLWQLLGCISLGAWVAINAPDTALQNGLNPWWVGAFNAVSAFNNSGMSLLDANMVAFQTSNYMLITMSLLILAGNTCYPVFLRFIIWAMHELLPDSPAFTETKSTLRFLLDHPRRCYTTLFPASHTWWLLGSLIFLNGTDWFAFEVLNVRILCIAVLSAKLNKLKIGNTLMASLPPGTRAIDGLFQAFAVRSGGFYVVQIANLRIGLLVLYVIMMYISVYPVTITMRNSNVYEERSLGIYGDDPMELSEDPERGLVKGLKRRLTNRSMTTSKEPRGYFVRQQLRGQLAHDLWWIVVAVLFIVIIETGQFEADPVNYSVFNIIFEVISAYGCVGISIGLPNQDPSFSGGWHVLSKLILCAVMLRGRHRGLPVAIDRAILLPGEYLGMAEEQDAQIRLEKTMSRARPGFSGQP